MLVLSDVKISYADRVLFEEVDLCLTPPHRYAIVGANGAGKSTLLRMVSGTEQPSEGTIAFPKEYTIGLLEQDHFRYEEMTISDVVIQGDKALWQAMEEKQQLLEKEDLSIDDGIKLGELEEIIGHHDGYTALERASILLEGLGIAGQFHSQPLSVLSGGFKLRVLLARVLFGKPDILLLDEPTNHLDIISIAWLEQFLVNDFKGLLIIVTHDRDFMNNVANRILDIDYQTILEYVGNYNEFVKGKNEFIEKRDKEIASQEKKAAHLEAFIERFRAKASKAKQAQSRVKQLDKMEMVDALQTTRQSPDFVFDPKRPSGKVTLEIEHLDKSFAEKHVLKDISCAIMRGERVGIVGENGIGKSTLLKIISHQLNCDRGEVKWGHESHLAYCAQDTREFFSEPITVQEWLVEHTGISVEATIRGTLGRMLFSGDTVKKRVTNLSGGERARLVFGKMMIDRPNVILLDEPTNHLDLESSEALAAALRKFPGTLLVVSHDRHFLNQTCTRIIALTHKGISDYQGNYAEYVSVYGEDFLARVVANSNKKVKPTPIIAAQKSTLSFDQRKELQKQINQKERRIAQLQEKMEKLEKEIKTIDAQFARVDFFDTASTQDIAKLSQQKKQLDADVKEFWQEWEKLESEVKKVKKELGE
jgi:ATPase subunit of ABC transporter with duplicated ATPase domains